MYNDRDTIFRGGLALIICLAGLIDVVAHFNEFGGNPWLNAYTSTQWVVGTFLLYLFGDICYQLYRRIRRVESYIHHALNIVLWSVASFIHLPITASLAIACGESITAARLLSLLQNKQLYLYSRIVLTLGPRTLFYLFVLYDSVMHPERFGFLSQAFVFRSCIVVAAIFLLGFDAYCMRLYIKRLIRFRKSIHP